MTNTSLSPEDFAAKRYEANQLFTPSAPIAVAELFAGRQRQIAKLVDAIGERGRHVILFGERGVGKSSIAEIVSYLIPRGPQQVRHIRIATFPDDDFSAIARRIFESIHFRADYGQGEKAYNVSEFYSGDITIDSFLNEIKSFKESEIPIIVIDEFNEIEDIKVIQSFANIMKALSDSSSNATIVLVAVADSIAQIFDEHQSIERCTEQIKIPRMTLDERLDILDKRIDKLGMSLTSQAKLKIVHLSKGLPAYVHAIGKHTVFKGLAEGRLHLDEYDVGFAITEVLAGAQQTLRDCYEAATRSNQARAKFRHILTACALAKADDAGNFTPAAIREPFSKILGRQIQIANYLGTLQEFAESRGKILERTGEARSYRFRFRNPAMQPYVIMRGLRDKILDEAALAFLDESTA